MTRQEAYMRRNLAKGLCRVCPTPIYKGGLCVKHYERQRERHAERKRERAGLIEEIQLVDGGGA